MLSKRDVEVAYELLLGRSEPNEQVIEGHMQAAPTLSALRQRFIDSAEFRNRIAPQFNPGKPLNWPAARVDTEVTTSQLAQMIARVERHFGHVGKIEPHLSVLGGSDKYRAENISKHKQEFYASGEGVVGHFQTAAERCGIALPYNGICLELGCGVGRSTIFLSRRFRSVLAADVSVPHLDLAREAMADNGCFNVALIHVASISVIENLPCFDAFFSIIVLQHNPPPLMAHLLRCIFNKLNPGGLAYFQIPTHGDNYSFDAAAYLGSEPKIDTTEMHTLPQHVIYSLASAADCRVLEVREDAAAGPRKVSNRILIQKRQAQANR